MTLLADILFGTLGAISIIGATPLALIILAKIYFELIHKGENNE